MTVHISGDDIIESVEEQRQGHHDTLYVTQEQEETLKRTVSRQIPLKPTATDSITVVGLTVEPLPDSAGLTRPIACQKGDVFPLARDWKKRD